MTRLGAIFRPWDLSSNETFVPKSPENPRDEAANTIKVRVENSFKSCDNEDLRRRMASRLQATPTESPNNSSDECLRRDKEGNSVKREPTPPFYTSFLRSEVSNGSQIHSYEVNHHHASTLEYIPGSPVDTPMTPTTPNFMTTTSINELASLSRSELTAMGLLPPEPPASLKVKRQRPKRFRCPHCQVAFSNNGQLRGHIRIHTGERPFACEHEGCGKSFTRNEELTRHRRIHTGLRPYPCTHCGKRFGRKDHLKKHTRTHQRPMYHAASGMIGLGNPFHPFNPSLIPPHSAINEFASPSSPYALPFMLSIPPPISHFPFT